MSHFTQLCTIWGTVSLIFDATQKCVWGKHRWDPQENLKAGLFSSLFQQRDAKMLFLAKDVAKTWRERSPASYKRNLDWYWVTLRRMRTHPWNIDSYFNLSHPINTDCPESFCCVNHVGSDIDMLKQANFQTAALCDSKTKAWLCQNLSKKKTTKQYSNKGYNKHFPVRLTPAFALRPADNRWHYHAYVVDRIAVGGHRRLPKNTRPSALLLTVASHGRVLSEPASEQQAGHPNPPFASLHTHAGRVFTQHERRHRALADFFFFFSPVCPSMKRDMMHLWPQRCLLEAH